MLARNARSLSLLALFIALLVLSCSEKVVLPPLGSRIASPIDMVYYPKGQLFFVLNSNVKHVYADGSISMVDKSGTLKKAVSVPRLGRSLTLTDDLLLVTFDRESDQGATSKIILYQIEAQNNAAPNLVEKKRWEFEKCSPLSAVLSKPANKAKGYIAASCQTGDILAGKLDISDYSRSTLQPIRKYPSGLPRRAIYIEPTMNLLYAFVTDMGLPDLYDRVLDDKQHWDSAAASGAGAMVDGPNDTPDVFESTKIAQRRLLEQGSEHQFAVMDLAASETNGFPFIDADSKQARSELHWLYYDFKDATPVAAGQKYYRTNIWEVKPGVPDSSGRPVFYFSQRGLGEANRSPDANNVVKVTVLNNDRTAVLNNANLTKDLFGFERIYGFSGHEKNAYNYIGGFALTTVDKTPTVVVNSFRDLLYFNTEYFTLTAATAQNYDERTGWLTSDASTSSSTSYFQVAASDEDAGAVHVLTGSYYGDAIILFKLQWGGDFVLVNRIE